MLPHLSIDVCSKCWLTLSCFVGWCQVICVVPIGLWLAHCCLMPCLSDCVMLCCLFDCLTCKLIGLDFSQVPKLLRVHLNLLCFAWLLNHWGITPLTSCSLEDLACYLVRHLSEVLLKRQCLWLFIFVPKQEKTFDKAIGRTQEMCNPSPAIQLSHPFARTTGVDALWIIAQDL